MKNKIDDLRDHLFQQLERLGDDDVVKGDGLEREIKRAKAMSDLAGTLIDSARVEVDFLKVKVDAPRLNGIKSDFIDGGRTLPAPGFEGREPNP